MTMLLLIVLHGLTAIAETLISCNDGDTCRFDKAGKVIKVRFSGIDAPESNQPFGSEAREYLTQLLKGNTVKLECKGKSFKRETCAIFIGDRDVQKELVKNGYAMDFPKFSKGKYKVEEELAKSKKIGIWSKAETISPFCWRYKTARPCNKNKLFQPK